MVNKEDWWLVQQTVQSNVDELLQEVALSQYTNLSLALQFNEKKKVLTQEEKEKYEAIKKANDGGGDTKSDEDKKKVSGSDEPMFDNPDETEGLTK